MGARVTLRDLTEAVLRSWNRYEVARGAPPVVDFDCHPSSADDVTATDRIAVRGQLHDLLVEADARPECAHIADRLGSALAYLDALLGARQPLDDYVQATQGCPVVGWTDDYVDGVRTTAVEALAGLGVTWGSDSAEALKQVEKPVDPSDAADVIQKYASDLEDDVRRLADTDAPFSLSVEHVDLDVYWAYWLDGAGSDVRMRINSRNASFTEVQARQFALHEVLGHGLQCASLAQECQRDDVPWVRITSVHAQQQVLFEGLAQALPLFVQPTDQLLTARVRLAHYVELVRAQLHIAINDGTPIADCIAFAKSHVPFWSDRAIADMLSDRGADPLLRSYLWSYPAGIDWFVRLADTAPRSDATAIIRAAYRTPLTPHQLTQMWPKGPAIGGSR
jgi:hypothetical protein